MSVQISNYSKLCSFYISDWHLVTMLLPYINKKINEQIEIATILEKDIKENVNTLVEKLNLKNKEKILNLEWNKKDIRENNIIKNLLSNTNNEKIIIVNGNKEYIEKVNLKLEEYINGRNIKSKIKIINCYEIVEFDGSITEILDKHDKVLNTSGEKEIEEIFEDYERKKQLEAI